MKIDKYSINGEKTGQVELAESVFAGQVNDVLIYELIKSANANLRQGTHSVKRRAEVRGGGAKPWRQKGTGRARAGSSRSPIWRGGGSSFGPKPRDYRIDLSKNIKQAAYRSLFSLKIKEGAVKVVENFSVQGKTKEMVQIASKLNLVKGVLITESEDLLLKRSLSNLSWLKYNNVKRISSREIFYSKDVLITESAVKILNDKYAKVN